MVKTCKKILLLAPKDRVVSKNQAVIRVIGKYMDPDERDGLIVVAGKNLKSEPFAVEQLGVRADGVVQVVLFTDQASNGDISIDVWLKAETRCRGHDE